MSSLRQLTGVTGSYTNESGTLIRLTLVTGTDPGRAAAAASRVLRAQTGDRIAVRLNGRAATTALRAEDWRDQQGLAPGVAAAVTPTMATPVLEARPSGGSSLLLLILAMAAVVFWLLWRRRREYQTAQ